MIPSLDQPRFRVISLGAGVQSTTVALMAAHGEIGPMPDCGIFADTGWEPRKVYEHLDWLEGVLPFPVYRVSAGNLRDAVLARRNTTGGRYAAVPWFTVNPDGSHGMGRRQCTSEYKLKPIMHKLRDLLGVDRRARIDKSTVEMWIGISTDEAVRMRPSRVQWQRNRWPLIEAGMSRADCARWLSDNFGRVAPKSACQGCPFHNNEMWRDQRDNAPEEWADSILIDRQMRLGNPHKMRATEFMHAQRVPLDEVDLEPRIATAPLLDWAFNNECEGMCGV